MTHSTHRALPYQSRQPIQKSAQKETLDTIKGLLWGSIAGAIIWCAFLFVLLVIFLNSKTL